jgi:crossover junction endodeoxyribonuclease RusA
MILELPYPPSNNRYYRHVGRKTLLSREGREYRLSAMHARPIGQWPMPGRVNCTIEVYPPTRWGQDLDNIPKAVCDALQASGVLTNDQQIDQLHVYRRAKDAANPRVVVTIQELPNEQQAPTQEFGSTGERHAERQRRKVDA